MKGGLLSEALLHEFLARMPPGFQSLPADQRRAHALPALVDMTAERTVQLRQALDATAHTFDGTFSPAVLFLIVIPAELELLRAATTQI